MTEEKKDIGYSIEKKDIGYSTLEQKFPTIRDTCDAFVRIIGMVGNYFKNYKNSLTSKIEGGQKA